MQAILDFLRELNIWTVIIRLVLSFFCGGAIGIERERRGRTAGLRTHILVCIGSCLTMLTGFFAVDILNYATDPLRIGAQVVSGIGFLGVGTIIVTRQSHIKGLTTAAGLWTTAAIGIALGAGFYEGALICLVLAMISIIVLERLEKNLNSTKSLELIYVYIEINGLENVNSVIKELKHQKFTIMSSEIEEAKSHNTSNIGMKLELRLGHSVERVEAFDTLAKIDNILFAVELT